ncbi:MAG: UV DNA damage repair endonuclease UvsE [Thermaerobacter sp.]|nr:UV DNA damage repair endonuclease UvsE [Thermaerobacter sp.]
MRVRFGFVAMSLDLPQESPSRTTTLARLRQGPHKLAMRRLTQLAAQNLESTLRIVRHAITQGIPLYRFSSRLIPFLGHPESDDWDFFRYLATDLGLVGGVVRDAGMRVSFHPEHAAVVLSADRTTVQAAAQRSLLDHARICDLMGLPEANLVVHMGGGYGDKPAAAQRFREAVAALPPAVRDRIALENDDRTFTVRDVLDAAQASGIPAVLDLLHHRCNPCEGSLSDLLAQVFSTWSNQAQPPKLHLSSARDARAPRAHADLVTPEDALTLLEAAREHGRDIDVMVEAKAKDHAVLRLVDDLCKVPGVQRVGGGTIRYRP